MQPRHDWSTGLDEAFWSRQRNRSGQPSDGEGARPVKRSADTRGQIVRTLCVRLCDGYYWPISFATTKRRLSVDARRCESACSSPAKLFFHRNPGQDTADMVDRDGKPYRELPAAFLYRTRYLADCTCRPQPWEEEAAARHRAFSQASGQAAIGSKAATLDAPTRSR
jgi:hypothetical protein